MSRNQNSRFAINPTNINIQRSSFDRNSSVKFSFNTGDIIPFYVDEVLPGDTFKVKSSKVVRLQTPITPFMDNLYMDTYYFFVPNRLTWEHWKEFNGENTKSAWYPTVEYEIPQITAPADGWSVGTIADYMGIPTGVGNISVNALPFRAYALICNEWFRDQNLSDPLNIPVNDTTVEGVNTGNEVTDVAKGGLPYRASKFHDYFTSALPAPQKGPDVTLPTEIGARYPVVAGEYIGDEIIASTSIKYKLWDVSENQWHSGVPFGSSSFSPGADSSVAPDENGVFGAGINTFGGEFTANHFAVPANLWADTSGGAAFGTTINQLRMAFQLQKLYEKDARGGTRYVEILKAHFGVTSPDYRQQRPEYLGGNRLPINVNQVVQQSATQEGSTPQGNTAAYSLTTDSHFDFSKSFTEHGFVIGLCVVRYDHTYQQGLERMWSRKDRFDYYWPVLANIGEQAIKNKEIYITGTETDDEVFGYQEAWAEYRYKPSRVAGEMRSSYQTSLDVWHLGDYYEELPRLSDAWIREDKTNVDRVLAVTSTVSNQLFADFYIQNNSTRAMPMYSIPGLIDHN